MVPTLEKLSGSGTFTYLRKKYFSFKLIFRHTRKLNKLLYCGAPAVSQQYTVSLAPWVSRLLPPKGGQWFASRGCTYTYTGTGFSC